MNKKVKITIGIVLTVLATISTPIILNLTKKEEINMESVKVRFEEILKEELKKENEKVSSEYKKKIEDMKYENSKKPYSIIQEYASVFNKYYEERNKDIVILFSLDDKSAKLEFLNKKEPQYIKDNETKDVNEETAYSVNHTIVLERNRVEKVNIELIRRANQKFDIKNNNLLIDYFNMLLGREMTDEEKTAINIKVNMDLEQVFSIKDLEKYIYSNDSIKIDNLIIKTSKDKKGENIKIEVSKEVTEESKEEK